MKNITIFHLKIIIFTAVNYYSILNGRVIIIEHTITHHANIPTVMFLNFQTPENFAVIYLKLKQRGQILGYFVKIMQMEYSKQ